MDLISVHPIFNLYNREWPVLTTIPPLPPAKFSDNGTAADSIVGAGAIIAGGHVERSVISYDAILNKGASVYGSVIMPGVKIGQNAVIRNAIVDKSAIIEPNANLGIDIDKDRKHFTVTDSGIVVVGKGQIVTA